MKYGLIGGKLRHSFSKPIHESIAPYSYELKEIPEKEFDSFMKEKNFSGINVTIPYKTAVIPYLDFIDPIAEKIGAVNTIVNKKGKLYGYNTDFYGFRGLLEKEGFNPENKKVLILGSGGTCKTVLAVCESLNASEITIVSRTGIVNYSNVYELHGDAEFIINTTPCGMYPDNFTSPVDLSRFKNPEFVVDVIYNPLKTGLCVQADKLGIKSCSALYMLVLQAVLSAEKFTEMPLDAEKASEEVFQKLSKEKRNIVLVGMPGSGKTTIGKALAEKAGKDFIDTDDMIKETYGDITAIFESYGEETFRAYETEKVKQVAILSGKVIATGGGAVLKNENIDALRQNGTIFFLDRPLEDIVPTDDRPLSSDYEALKKRYEERYDRYLEVSDYVIRVDGVADNAVNLIMEIIK